MADTDAKTTQEVETKSTAPTPPNKEEYEAKLKKLDEGLLEVTARLGDLQIQIDAEDEKSSSAVDAREQTMGDLRTIRIKKAEANASTSSVRSQLAQLDKERMEIRRNIQSTRKDLRFTDVKSFDKYVKDQLKKGTDKADIERLKLQRPFVILLDRYMKDEEKNEKASEALRKQVDTQNKEAQKLRKQETKLMDKLKGIEKKQENKELKALLGQQRKAVDQKKKLGNAKRALINDFDKAEHAYKRAVRKQARLEAQKKAPAARKEEKKEVDAPHLDKYGIQKHLCADLIAYLRTLLPMTEKKVVKKAARGRSCRNADFAGKKVVKPTNDDDEPVMGGIVKKGKKKRRHQQKKVQERVLSHPRKEIAQFARVSVSPPLYLSQVKDVIATVEAKAKAYESGNPDVTPAASQPTTTVQKSAGNSLDAFLHEAKDLGEKTLHAEVPAAAESEAAAEPEVESETTVEPEAVDAENPAEPEAAEAE